MHNEITIYLTEAARNSSQHASLYIRKNRRHGFRSIGAELRVLTLESPLLARE